MIPPRGAQVTRPPALLAKPGKPARRDVIGQARSYQARSWWAARSYQARAPKVATLSRATQDKPSKSLISRRKSLRSRSRQHHGLRRTNGRSAAAGSVYQRHSSCPEGHHVQGPPRPAAALVARFVRLSSDRRGEVQRSGRARSDPAAR
jgi:hypothetical protein